MTGDETPKAGDAPKVGDVIELQILRGDDYRYFVADNVVITHMKSQNFTGLELHAVATETGLVSSQVTLTEVEPNSPATGKPSGIMAAAHQVHVGTMRVEIDVALDMLVAAIGHMKRQNLGDMDKAAIRIREALEG